MDVDKLAADLADLVFVKIAEEDDEDEAVAAPANEGGGSNWSRWVKGLALAGGLAAGAGVGLWAVNKYAPQLGRAANATGEAASNLINGRDISAPPPKPGIKDYATPGNVGAGVGIAALAAKNPLTTKYITGTSSTDPKSVEHGSQLNRGVIPTVTSGLNALNAATGGVVGKPTTNIEAQQNAISKNIKAEKPLESTLQKMHAWTVAPPEERSKNYQAATESMAKSQGQPAPAAAEGKGKEEKPKANPLATYQAQLDQLKSSPGTHAVNAAEGGAYLRDPASGQLVRPENFSGTLEQLLNAPIADKTIQPLEGQPGKSKYVMTERRPGEHVSGDVANLAHIAGQSNLDIPTSPDAKLQMAQAQIIKLPKIIELHKQVADEIANAGTNPQRSEALKIKEEMLRHEIQRRMDIHDALLGKNPTGRPTNRPSELATMMERAGPAVRGTQSLRQSTAPSWNRSLVGAGARGVGAGALTAAAQEWLPGLYHSLGFGNTNQPEVVQ